MIPTTFRNFLCATGLVLGLLLIASASVAQTRALPCSAEGNARAVEEVTDDGLPIICERFIITAPARMSVLDRLRSFDFTPAYVIDMTPELPDLRLFRIPERLSNREAELTRNWLKVL